MTQREPCTHIMRGANFGAVALGMCPLCLTADIKLLQAENERLRAAIQEMTTRAGAAYARDDAVEWLESIVRVGEAALNGAEQSAGD